MLARVQSRHMCGSTTYSTTKACCRMAPFMTSAWMVSFTFSRRECGSVHTKPASTSFTCARSTVHACITATVTFATAYRHIVGHSRAMHGCMQAPRCCTANTYVFTVSRAGILLYRKPSRAKE